MLVTRRAGRLVLVTQPDHAAIAGTLAEHWGNERFTTPIPHAALVCAATHHDDGWPELDGRPMFNHQQQRPAHFVELSLTETAAPYARGVESVYERDPHAGALVSMHFSGFYTSRWGVGGGSPSENPLALEVIAAQEARWMPALRQAWAYRGRRSEFDAATWHAYEVLQAVDLLSLALCEMDLERPGDGAPVDVTETLARVDQIPGPRLVTGVPAAAGGPYLTVEVSPAPMGIATVAHSAAQMVTVTLDPYPLSQPTVEVTIALRELDDRAYVDQDDAARAFHAAGVRELTVALTWPRPGPPAAAPRSGRS